MKDIQLKSRPGVDREQIKSRSRADQEHQEQIKSSNGLTTGVKLGYEVSGVGCNMWYVVYGM
ncbi:hypothetical protein [Paenibacillus silvae]|uniref:hypothetical protein n=1 Tax=Paenibacillus silvae TaxID=1325358 RepID=UPI00200412A3|nr:hypothetical protein [Paenibacillus silvae]MCK6077919.1 hypothetical protein [Paenibacillus silvae]MCK6152118.1 hypothetical protein [Paenibacillus silvae]MCK6270803.1 hypothetical protein [Paenibacillus silvae]